MTQISFRLATENDRDFIRQLSARVFSLYGDYDELLPNWMSLPGLITVIVTENNHPLGFAMLEAQTKARLGSRRGELMAIAVMPEYQRRGIGSALLDHMESLALRYGLSRIQLHTARDNILARWFFKRAGFRVIGVRERYYPEGQQALAMIKVLEARGEPGRR
ncbi:MAG: GNAT family N-acetyltransferase [Syntrophobacteria bacterium]